MTTQHEDRALADPRLFGDGSAFFDQLERYLRLEHPELKNIRVTSAKPTEESKEALGMKWYNVTFTAND